MAKKFSVLLNKKITKFNKTISVDGDKSISFRALMIASQCMGVTHLKGLLEGEDINCCIQCLKDLGVKISELAIKDDTPKAKATAEATTTKKADAKKTTKKQTHLGLSST